MEKRFDQALGFIYRQVIEGIIMYFLFDVSGLITYISETNYSDLYEMKRDLRTYNGHVLREDIKSAKFTMVRFLFKYKAVI